MKIWTVDAFTSKLFSGNPAAVMIMDEFPSDETCQKIATEMNLSETAFVKPLGSHCFHLRWFTPAVEVKLCGHATLAAAHILFQENVVQANVVIQFESLSGSLFVSNTPKGLSLNFPVQKTGPALDKKFFEEILSVKIVTAEKAYDDLIIEIESEKQLRTLQINFDKISKLNCRGLIVTAKSEGPYDFVSRFFAPRVGVNEDPVTGSAHCKLVDYWQKRLHKNHFFAYQASSRGGELWLEIKDDRVSIIGNAVTVIEGHIFLEF